MYNYRPISLLSNVNNIFRVDLWNFLRKDKSFITNILLFEKISQQIIDLEKAFDTVSHGILIKKLDHYGIRGISNDWFRCYLSEASQMTGSDAI